MSTAARSIDHSRTAGSSRSEGGFAEGRYAAASLLDYSEKKDSKGRNYYTYELLVRTADGDEGGRHQLIKSTVRPSASQQIRAKRFAAASQATQRCLFATKRRRRASCAVPAKAYCKQFCREPMPSQDLDMYLNACVRAGGQRWQPVHHEVPSGRQAVVQRREEGRQRHRRLLHRRIDARLICRVVCVGLGARPKGACGLRACACTLETFCKQGTRSKAIMLHSKYSCKHAHAASDRAVLGLCFRSLIRMHLSKFFFFYA